MSPCLWWYLFCLRPLVDALLLVLIYAAFSQSLWFSASFHSDTGRGQERGRSRLMAVWPTSIFTADQWCRPCWFQPIKTGAFCAVNGWWRTVHESQVCIVKTVQRRYKEPWRPSGQLTQQTQKREKEEANTCTQWRHINQEELLHNRTHFDWSIRGNAYKQAQNMPEHGLLHRHSRPFIFEILHHVVWWRVFLCDLQHHRLHLPREITAFVYLWFHLVLSWHYITKLL